MPLLSCSGLSLWFGEREIISGAAFSVEEGSRVGLVGVNGCGKTTLFKLITGELTPDEGSVVVSKFTKIGYMEQMTLDSGKSLYDEVLEEFRPLMELEDEISRLADRLDTDHDLGLIERHHALTEQYNDGGGLTYRARARSTLAGLGFSEEQITGRADILSGGQRSKAQLAKLLLSGANLLLLDEPTNHLDITATRWLEDFLNQNSVAYMVISHDRYFLDRVTRQTFELQNRHLTVYQGGYSAYVAARDARREITLRHNENTQREIKRVEGIVEQQKRFNQERNYVTIASKEKQIERLKDRLETVERPPDEISFRLAADEPVTNDILRVDRLAMSYGRGIHKKQIFSDLDMMIHKNERVFLVGPNGCGKTSLLKVLASRIPGDAGSFLFGPGVTPSYYEQSLTSLHDDKTAINEIWDRYPKMNETEIRSALARFLFKGDAAFARVGQLSGGERARLALLNLMLSGANFLMLDEPTNHLDIASREVLERALLSYGGTLLIVSHDRYFINKLATRIYYMNVGGMITEYKGDYDAMEMARAGTALPEMISQPQKTAGAIDYKQRREQESARRRAEGQIKRTEARLAELEAETAALGERIASPEVASDYEQVLELTGQLERLRREEDELYGLLEELL